MKPTLIERVSNTILREVNKWDGVTNHDELMQVVRNYSRPLAKRIVRMVHESLVNIPTPQVEGKIGADIIQRWHGAGVHNEIARRFSGPEGDAAVRELQAAFKKLYRCAGCGNEVKGRDLVIDPGNNYFYHEKGSGEICGRYELVVEVKGGA